jgi:O-antigen/teichoic acid export membrane protein
MIHAFVYFIPSIILMVYLFRIKELSFKRSRLVIPRKFRNIIVSFSLFSYTNTIGFLIVGTIDALMIAYYLGLKETGIYTTMIYVCSALLIPYKSIVRISGPLVPQYWKERNMIEMKAIYVKVSSVSLFIILLLFLFIWSNRIELFSFLPADFSAGIYVFFFIMIGRIFDSYFGLNGLILVTSKKFKYDILFTLFLVILVFVLNYLLIPIYGMYGAAISTGLSLIFFNIFRLIFVYYHFKIHPFTLKQFKIIMLFFIVFFLMETIKINLEFTIVTIVLKSGLISILFLVPIFFLNLEPEVSLYVNKIIKTILPNKKNKKP